MTQHTSDTTEASSIGFLGNAWVPKTQMLISIDDGGFRQGVTAVERLRTYDHQIFAIDAHLDRWDHSTAELSLGQLPARSVTRALLHELLERNQALLDSQGEVGITLFATPGTALSASPTFGMHVNSLNFKLIQQRQTSGQPLVITSVRQPSPECWPRTVKSRSRLHYYLADREAQQHSPLASGLLIDDDGTVTETSISNIAVVKANQIQSPGRDQVLHGITQAFVEELANELGMRWSHSPITPEKLMAADEVLLMGTDGGLWYADQINGQTIGNARPGEVYSRLLQHFQRRLSTGMD